MSYEEETTENNNSATWVKRTTDELSYTVDGNMAASHETTENALGVQGEVRRTEMLYDQQNRLESYGMETRNTAEGSTTGMAARRTGIGYNGLGDATKYVEEQVKRGNTAVEQIEWKGSYGVLGLVGRSEQVTRRTGELIAKGETRRLDVTERTRTEGMKYTRDGSNLREYQEELRSTASPEMVQRTRVSGATYDAYGRLGNYTQTEERVTAGAVKGDGGVDEEKAAYHAAT
jgi:hypothetical protein